MRMSWNEWLSFGTLLIVTWAAVYLERVMHGFVPGSTLLLSATLTCIFVVSRPPDLWR